MMTRKEVSRQWHVYGVTFLLVACWAGTRANGGITVSGDLTPAYTGADPWTLSGSDLRVGDAAAGSMEVSLGSSVDSYSGWLAYDPDTVGDVDIIGVDSLWSIGSDLVVGYYGDAVLTIADGGQVTAYNGALGFMPGSTGSADVTGADSAWNVDEDFIVGVWGQGEVDITNGGQVTNEDGYIGGYYPYEIEDEILTVGYEPNGVGRVLVSGAGSSWTTEDTLYVGYTSDANMVIADGGQAVDEYALMGYEEGTQADVTVRGAGSVWTHTGGLGVGIYGDGDLVVENGGRVSSLESGIAIGSNGVGTVEVTGTDSLWSNTEELAIGIMGTGTLTIANGGRVTNTTAYLGGLDPEAPNIDVSFILSDTLEGTGIVAVTGSGSRWDNDGFLYVGYTGTGVLDVNDGGLVTSEYGAVGADPNGTGTVTIIDTGSRWSIAEGLAVGGYGQGALTIASGGLVDANAVYVGGFDIDDFGGDANEVAIGTGTLTVSGTGAALDVNDFLYVGYTGTGTLDVNEGGVVASEYGAVGADPNGTGTARIIGTGSQWNVAEGLAVGGYGDGDLTIASGGVVDANVVYIGGFRPVDLGGDANGVPDGTGTLTVTGTNSQISGRDGLYAGYTGEGTLTVSDGALVDTDEIQVGVYDTGTLSVSDGGVVDSNFVWIGVAQDVGFGVATVTGNASLWDANDAYIGAWGQGELTVSAGGHMVNEDVLVGAYWSSTGTATVTGSGSLWEVQDDLHVGYDGDGTLVVSDGGQVTSDNGMIASDWDQSVGRVTVTGAGSRWDVAGGLYIGGNATTVGGTAVLDVNDGGAVTAGDVIIWDDGTLSGDSTLTAPTVTNYGTIAPGNSIGTLTIDGDVTMDANSVLAVEVDNSDNSDRLHVTGDVEIQGGTVQVSSEETIRGTHQYTILDANSVTGTFDTVDTALVRAAAVTSELDYDTSLVTLELTALGFDIGQTRNQRALGVGLQEIAVGGGNTITSLLQAVPTDEELLEHYDQLGGQSRPSLAPIVVAGTSRFLGTVSDRLRQPSSTSVAGVYDGRFSNPSGPSTPVGNGFSCDIDTNGYSFAIGNGTPYLSDRPWGFWAKGFGLFGNRDDDVEAPGYDYTTYGLAFGLDYQVSDAWLLGVTTGYADGDVDYDRVHDNTDVSATHIGCYGSWDMENLYLDSLLTYSDLDYETERRVDLASERLEGDFGGYALSGYVETGFDWRYIQGWLLQPLASFQFSYLDLDSYTETGGDAALGYDDQRYESYQGSLGVKVSKNLLRDEPEKSLVTQFRARWLHEFGDTYSRVDTHFASDPTTVFTIRDEAMARDSAVLGVGLGAQLGRNTRLYADYDARLNADDTAHLVSAGLRYEW